MVPTLSLEKRIGNLKEVLKDADVQTKDIMERMGRLDQESKQDDEVTETTDYCPGWGQWSQWAQWFN